MHKHLSSVSFSVVVNLHFPNATNSSALNSSDFAYDSVVYDQMKTGSSESQAEAEELNQSQSVGTCIVIGLSFSASASNSDNLLKRNVSDGVVSGVRRKWKRSYSSDSDYVALMAPLTTIRFLIFTRS